MLRQERQDLLSFVVVGGGPTGVEVAAELYDLIKEDLSRFYPTLAKSVAQVRLVELQDHILSTYDREISEYAAQLFGRWCSYRTLRSPNMSPLLLSPRVTDAHACARAHTHTHTRALRNG